MIYDLSEHLINKFIAIVSFVYCSLFYVIFIRCCIVIIVIYI